MISAEATILNVAVHSEGEWPARKVASEQPLVPLVLQEALMQFGHHWRRQARALASRGCQTRCQVRHQRQKECLRTGPSTQQRQEQHRSVSQSEAR